MMVSTRGRYALRILVDLAENQRDGFVTLKELAERQEISEKYLESIVKGLVRSGVLEGLRGKGGGYRLSRSAEDIRVLDVLARTEHLRWVASHEVLGYSDSGTENDKDEARLTHGCLKPWEQLTPRTQSYDYNVVDVSLDIIEVKEKEKGADD